MVGLCVTIYMYAKTQEVCLIVSGEGPNKTEATNNALRMAIEQAFGTFVSSNTTILNDDIVKNEIATISSGNIKSFKEIASSLTPSGESYVTLNVVVSIGKLISYAKSHGSSAEFAGKTFAANIKMRELNLTNELSALEALATQIENLSNSLFDFEIEPDNYPQLYNSLDEQGYIFYVIINLKSNESSNSVQTMLLSTLGEISLSAQEVEEYKMNNYPYEVLRLNNIEYIMRSDKSTISKFIIRIKDALNIAFFNFTISTDDPLNIEYNVDISQTDSTLISLSWKANYNVSRTLNVCSDYSTFSESVVCPDEFESFNMKSRYKSYDYGDELYIPCFSDFSNKGMVIAKLIVPIFIKTADINNLTGFNVKRTPIVSKIITYAGSLEVGDILSEYGEGVVFWISKVGTEAKIISTNEIAGETWSESLSWCQNYGDGSWNLPSREDLTLVQKASSIINDAATSHNLQKLDMGNIRYWSSTEYSEFRDDFVYQERMNDGLGSYERKSSTQNRARAIKTIQIKAD